MKPNISASETKDIAINRVKHYPLNPRRGDVNAIADSLQHHGQYRPIVVQKSTNFVLAGNHTLKAARKLGWTRIAATFVDCDDMTARRIVLADNRLNDLADYDQLMLKESLEALPDLEGTGFTQSDIAALDSLINDPFDAPKDPSARKDPNAEPEVKIGAWRFYVLRLAYEAWNDQISDECEGKKDAIRQTIKDRLGIPEPVKEQKQTAPDMLVSGDGTSEIVPLTEIKQHPMNARQGDVGEIMESLKNFGQYRPIVANRKTKHVLVGNHTYTAATLLSWDGIAVTWVDCDEIEEMKILLVDNRTSDLASYDSNELSALVLESGNLAGTGYTADDLAEIQSGSSMKNQPIGKVTIKVGKYSMRISSEQMSELAKPIHSWHDLAEKLGFPLEACRNTTGLSFSNDHE